MTSKRSMVLAVLLLGVFTVWCLSASAHGQGTGPAAPQAQPQQHPLAPALEIAKRGLENIEKNIKDYSCTLVKRERVDGELTQLEYMFTKVRHEPFGVYMYFLGPDNVKGREVIYHPTANSGNLIAHEGSGIKAKFGAVSLKPDSMLAMRGNRHPISEVGIKRLTTRLIEVAEHDMQYGECEVKFFQGAKVNGRTATCIQVMHPVPRREFIFHLARIFIDDELQVPIRYEAYDWPTQTGGQPVLVEEYTYMNLKLNNNFTDADFDTRNPNYSFK